MRRLRSSRHGFMSPPKSQRNGGLDPFRGVLRDVGELWTWGAGAATVPLVANLVSLAPPWPRAIVYLTAVIELITLIVAFHFFKTSPRRVVNRVLASSVAVLLVTSVVYLALLSEFTYSVPGDKT